MDTGKETIDISVEPRTLQIMLKSLGDENSKLQREIAELKEENRNLCKQLPSIDGHVITQEEIEELERCNEEKDKEIYSLKCQLAEAVKSHQRVLKKQAAEIRKLNLEIDDEITEKIHLHEELWKKDKMIQGLEYILDQKDNALSVSPPALHNPDLQSSHSEEGTVDNRGTEREVQGAEASPPGRKPMSQYLKVADEDSTLRWKICMCGSADCPTCVAEKAALASAYNKPSCNCKICLNCGGHRQKYNTAEEWRINDGKGPCKCSRCLAHRGHIHRNHMEEEWADEDGKPPSKCQRCLAHREHRPKANTEEAWADDDGYLLSDIEDTRHVSISKEPEANTMEEASEVLYRFHVSISDSAVSEHSKPSCQTCSISALLFAYKYKTNPNEMSLDGVSDQLFSQVLDSINEASENVHLNFKGRKDQLGPTDTLQANSHLGLDLVEDIEIDMSYLDTLVPYIFHIEPSQILLLYRMTRYKVLSILGSDDGQKILIFDPQWHWVTKKNSKKTSWYGAYLFCVLKKVEAIEEALFAVKQSCGRMLGTCKLAILDRKST